MPGKPENHFSLTRAAAFRKCGTIVLVLLAGLVLASAADPLDCWTVRASGTTGQFNGVAYGNGTFVAVGGMGMVRTSPDGVAWTQRSSGVTASLRGVTFADGRFLAVGTLAIFPNQVHHYVLASTNGVNWTTLYVETGYASIIPPVLAGVAGVNGTIVAVGGATAESAPMVITSPDGVHWLSEHISSASEYALFGVAYANGLWYAVGGDGLIVYSNDRTNWVQLGSGGGARTSITFGAGTFLTTWDTGVARADTLGLEIASCSNMLMGITYGSNYFVAVGARGSVLTGTDDLRTWTVRPPCTADTLNAVTFGNGTFLAVGANGTIIQSGDATRPWFSRLAFSSGNGVLLTIRSPRGEVFTLEQSVDLQGWSQVCDVTNVAGVVTREDPGAAGDVHRFYRLTPKQ